MLTFAWTMVSATSAFLCVVACLRGKTWPERTVAALALAFIAGAAAGVVVLINC